MDLRIQLMEEHPDVCQVLSVAPLRVDNCPEFTSAVFHQWAEMSPITVESKRPWRPSDYAFAESFIGKLRDECLNEHWFLNLAHAQKIIEAWRVTFNTERPHSSLNNLTPYEFIKEQAISFTGRKTQFKTGLKNGVRSTRPEERIRPI